MINMKILYLDCFSGIAGDMFLGAMVDAGLNFEKLSLELGKMDVEDYRLKAQRVSKKGIWSTKFSVILEREAANPHMKYTNIAELIKESKLEAKVKEDALGIFSILAKAEMQVHGKKALSEVTFHEVGGIDSIVDIVGAAIAVNEMGISQVFCSKLNVGHGKARIHGVEYQIPAPATREILKGIPTYFEGEGEMVTPTGASIVKYYVRKFAKPQMNIIKEGYGAGDIEFKHPNVLKATIGEKK